MVPLIERLVTQMPVVLASRAGAGEVLTETYVGGLGLLVSRDPLVNGEMATLLSRRTWAEPTGLEGGTGRAGSKA